MKKEELDSLWQCNSTITKGKVVDWKGSENLWSLSNVSNEEFENGADTALCGKKGCFTRGYILPTLQYPNLIYFVLSITISYL